MTATPIDWNRCVFAKTALGQQEIQSRSLGLTPLLRRLLILVDGKRTGQELAALVSGHELADLLGQLTEKACIEPVNAAAAGQSTPAAAVPVPPSGTPEAAPPTADSVKPAATETLTAEQNQMARNFMINTINMVFGHHMRVSLIEAISNSVTTDELRQVYAEWFKAIGSDRNGAKQLPDLNAKLLKVLSVSDAFFAVNPISKPEPAPRGFLASRLPEPVLPVADLSMLPDAATRSTKENDMARNFMMNTINSVFGQHMQVTLIEAIGNCASTADLRRIYPEWYKALSSNRSGAKELPVLNDKLLQVL